MIGERSGRFSHGTALALRPAMHSPLLLICSLFLCGTTAKAQVVGGGWDLESSFGYIGSPVTAVATPGDVDGDGKLDLFILDASAPRATLLSSRDLSPLWTTVGLGGSRLGAAVNAGDLNGDGVADLLIGLEEAPGPSGSAFSRPGKVQVISGKDGVILDTLWGPGDGAHFGCSLATLRDINGDGVSDFLVGASGQSSLVIPAGAVYLYSGLDRQELRVLHGSHFGAQFGWSVAPLKDVDYDFLDDFIVGSPGHRWERGRRDRDPAMTGEPARV